MRILPAMDLRGGQCVRLRQGDYSRETVFGADPVAIARQWVEQGAAGLHLVDLDGAKEGRPVHTALIERIVGAAGVPVQLGGGLRSEKSLRAALDLGIARAIVGTRAVREPAWFAEMAELFPERLILGLDARDGLLATEGWLETTAGTALDAARWADSLPLAGIVYTDIARDGMMSGPNVAQTAAIASATRHPVIASGGIATIDDVLELAASGIGACILGRSIYEGTIKLPELFQRLGRQQQP